MTSKARALFSVVTVCALLLIGCSQKGNPVTDHNVVATVNDHLILSKYYEVYFKNGGDGLGIDPSSAEGRQKLDKLREGIVLELIDRALVRQEAERRRLSIDPAKLKEAETRAITQLGGEQKYDAYLAENQFSRDEYRESVFKTEIYGELLRAEWEREGAKLNQELGSLRKKAAIFVNDTFRFGYLKNYPVL